MRSRERREEKANAEVERRGWPGPDKSRPSHLKRYDWVPCSSVSVPRSRTTSTIKPLPAQCHDVTSTVDWEALWPYPSSPASLLEAPGPYPNQHLTSYRLLHSHKLLLTLASWPLRKMCPEPPVPRLWPVPSHEGS